MSDQSKAPIIALQKLRSENEDLRNELRQISSKLDEVLSKQTVEPQAPKEDRNLKISSIQKLIASIEREIEILRTSASSGSIEYKLKLEEETASLKERVRELTVKNKDLQRQVDGSSRKIEALSNNEEPRDQKKILEELRTSKEKLKEIELKYQGELQRSTMIKTKIQELENEAKESGIDTNNLYSSKSSKKVENIEIDQDEKKRLENLLSSLEKEKNSINSNSKKRVSEIHEGKSSIKEEISKLAKVLKEKEHDIKIKEHEINDLKRNQKNLQTKMNPMPDIMIEATKESPKGKKIAKASMKSEVKEEDKPKEMRVRQLSIHDETEKKSNSSRSSSGSEKKVAVNVKSKISETTSDKKKVEMKKKSSGSGSGSGSVVGRIRTRRIRIRRKKALVVEVIRAK